MPVGAHWTLSYEATVDGRIQARDHAHRLRLDEFVQHVDLTLNRGAITLGVQFYYDRERPYDERLAREIQWYQVVPREPEPEPTPPRSFDQIINDCINSPISRVRLGQSMAAPLRNRLDYTATARRTFLAEIPNVVADPPYSSGIHSPLSNDQYGDSFAQDLANLQRTIAAGLQVPEELLSGHRRDVSMGCSVRQPKTATLQDVPKWIKPGVWVTCKDMYATIEEIFDEAVIREPLVKFKLWRRAAVAALPLGAFLSNWVQCEKPADPTSRYERIIKGI